MYIRTSKAGFIKLTELIVTNKKVIFIVDDDDDDRMFLREAMNSMSQNIDIKEAVDGKQLQDFLIENSGSESTALILMDVNMPRLNGMETLSWLRSQPVFSHIPVVIFSTVNSPALVKQAYDFGIELFVTKPSYLDKYLEIAADLFERFLQ